MINVADFIRWVRSKGVKDTVNPQSGKPYLVKVMPESPMPVCMQTTDLDMEGEMEFWRFITLCEAFGLKGSDFESWCAQNPVEADAD